MPTSAKTAKSPAKAAPATPKAGKAKAAAEELESKAVAKKATGRKAAGPAKPAAEKSPPPKRGAAGKAAARDQDDADLSDIEADLEGEPEAAAPEGVEKAKPLRMKISKAKERALMKEFGLDEGVLSEEEMNTRRANLKALQAPVERNGTLVIVQLHKDLVHSHIAYSIGICLRAENLDWDGARANRCGKDGELGTCADRRRRCG